MITNDRHKLEKFKQKSSFRIAMAVFVLITILLNLPSSVYCNNNNNNNNKSVEETEENLTSTSIITTTDETEEYYNKNMKLHRIQTPEGPEHRSLDIEHRYLDVEHRSSDDQPTETRPIFTPRVEYNSWQPVGRGDPLKNDPTYDYSPPVVEPVRYWAENTKNENPANSITNKKEITINKDKNEILILGVPAKRQNYRKESKYIQNHEPPLESTYNNNKQQYNIQENQNQNQHQTTASKLQGTIRRSYSYGHYHNLPTRLMPPPMQTIAPPSTIISGNKLMPTTESYYHTYHHHYSSIPSTLMTYTSNSNNNNAPKTSTNTGSYFQYPSSSLPISNPPTWIYNKPSYDTRNAESISYVSITKPEANGIVSIPQISSSFNIKQPHFKRKPWIHELLSKEITKSPPLMEGTNYVSPQPLPSSLPPPPPQPSPPSQPPTSPQPPKTPQPTYIHQKPIMNTMKPIKQIINVTNGFIPIVTTQPPIKSTALLLVSPASPKYSSTTATTTTISTTSEPITSIKPSPTFVYSTYPSKTTTTKFVPKTTSITTKFTTLRPRPNQIHFTSMKSQTMTTPKNKLTTDALFSHYKQPERPLFGPLYLIIEGHSKVKKYGLKDNDTKSIHEPKIVPIEVPVGEAIVKNHVVLKDENGQAMEVKHLHNKKSDKNEQEDKSKTLQNNRIEENESEPISLLSFLDSSLGSLFRNDDSPVNIQNNHSITTTTTITEKSKEIEKSSMIFVTTTAPPKNMTTTKSAAVTKTTVLEPIKSALIQDSKERRQIFDYDQFDKPSIFDFFNTGEEYNDYEDIAKEAGDNQNLNEREIILSSDSSQEDSNERNMELNASEC